MDNEIKIVYKYEDDDEVTDSFRLVDMNDDDIDNKLLNYYDEIQTNGGFFIVFDNYLDPITKKYYDNENKKSVRLGEVLKHVYDEYMIYEKQNKIMYHGIGDLFVEVVSYNECSKTFQLFIGS